MQADSSTEDDLDATNNNHLRLSPGSKSDQNVIPRSVIAADDAEQKPTISSSASDRQTIHSVSGSRQRNIIGSGQTVKRSVPLVQSADFTGSGRTSLFGSGQPSLVNRSDKSIQSEAAHPAEITEGFSSRAYSVIEKSDCNVGLSSSAKITNTATANDVATFSLAFDDFLDSEDNDIIDQVTVYTQLKPLEDRTFAEKPDDNSPLVSLRQAIGTCRQTVSRSDLLTGSSRLGLIGSGQPRSEPASTETMPLSGHSYSFGSERLGLIGSGQPSSVPRSVPSLQSKTTMSTMSRSHSLTVPQPECRSGSGQSSLTGSQQPGLEAERLREERIRLSRLKKEEFQSSLTVLPPDCRTGSVQSSLTGLQQPGSISGPEAERLRDERLRLSRLKKEEFQRKHASTLSSNQTRIESPSPSVSMAGTENRLDDPRNRLRILVDSRELSGAQVS